MFDKKWLMLAAAFVAGVIVAPKVRSSVPFASKLPSIG